VTSCRRIRIGLTAGDPSGIGPEVLEAALQSERLPQNVDWQIIGNPLPRSPGKPDRTGAQQAWDALEESAQKLLSGEIDAIVTGPISKKALHQISFPFPGQTEFFAARAHVANFAMCLSSPRLTVALVTAHIPLAGVSSLLRSEEIIRVGHLLFDFLKLKTSHAPCMAVAGLNPHAGEEGDLGREEIEIIAPAVALLKNQIGEEAVFGPMAPDSLFHRAIHGEFDGVLCMYHDQGLIPLKMDGFDEGVNITLGLPFVRTSPDHGTAYDIVGKGKARPDSMLAAMKTAAMMVEQHKRKASQSHP